MHKLWAHGSLRCRIFKISAFPAAAICSCMFLIYIRQAYTASIGREVMCTKVYSHDRAHFLLFNTFQGPSTNLIGWLPLLGYYDPNGLQYNTYLVGPDGTEHKLRYTSRDFHMVTDWDGLELVRHHNEWKISLYGVLAHELPFQISIGNNMIWKEHANTRIHLPSAPRVKKRRDGR